MNQLYAGVQFESKDRGVDSPWRIVACLMLGMTCLAGCQPMAAPAVSARQEFEVVDHLLELMKERLSLMHDVARWKWNQQAAITDPEREQKLLDGIVEQAKAGGVDTEFAREFFAAQIEAAKIVQQADFDRWKSENQPPFADAVDLAEIRQQIDQINAEMLAELGVVVPQLKQGTREGIERRIDTLLYGGVNAPERDAAVEPLRQRAAQSPQ